MIKTLIKKCLIMSKYFKSKQKFYIIIILRLTKLYSINN